MESTRRSLYRLDVTPDDSGQRLDQLLAARIPGFSRTFARKIIDIGGVHCDGRRTRQCGQTVRGGQRIEVHVDGLPLELFSLGAEHVIFQDEFLLVLNKPTGIDTQPTHARYRGTLYEALQRFLQNPSRPHLKPELGMVQRLDRDTSGVLVFSTHQRSHKGLTDAVRTRTLEKTYLALIHGMPGRSAGEIRSQLARGRKDNRMKSVSAGGKEAITRFRVLHAWRDHPVSLVQVEIPTGRSHQIRVHFAEEGHPLLGDLRYGGPGALENCPIPRQMLHSWRLRLRHPVSGGDLVFQAPLPQDLCAVMTCLGGDFACEELFNSDNPTDGYHA